MARMPNGPGYRGRARLQMEALEERALLTIAGFEFNLYADSGSGPGEQILADTVEVGDSFFVEITAEDLRENATGLAGYAPGIRGLALDISWDPQVFQIADDPFDTASGIVTDNFPLYRDGKLDNTAGRIDDLQGAMFVSSAAGELIGEDGPERFALLRFRAIEAAENSTLSMNLGFRHISMFPTVLFVKGSYLAFESQMVIVVEPSESESAESATVELANTDPGGSEVQVTIYQSTDRSEAMPVAVDAVDTGQGFFIEIDLGPPTVAASAPARLDVASLPLFVNGAIDFTSGELTVTQIVVDVNGVSADLPLAAGPLEAARFVSQQTRLMGISYRPHAVEDATDVVFAAAPAGELAAPDDVYFDHGLLQALACGLAAALVDDEVANPFGMHPI